MWTRKYNAILPHLHNDPIVYNFVIYKFFFETSVAGECFLCLLCISGSIIILYFLIYIMIPLCTLFLDENLIHYLSLFVRLLKSNLFSNYVDHETCRIFPSMFPSFNKVWWWCWKILLQIMRNVY